MSCNQVLGEFLVQSRRTQRVYPTTPMSCTGDTSPRKQRCICEHTHNLRLGAFLPVLYIAGMLALLNKPNRQYASSSTRVVLQPAAHGTRAVTLTSAMSWSKQSTQHNDRKACDLLEQARWSC